MMVVGVEYHSYGGMGHHAPDQNMAYSTLQLDRIVGNLLLEPELVAFPHVLADPQAWASQALLASPAGVLASPVGA